MSIELQELTKIYSSHASHSVEVIKNLVCTISQGSFVGILGPSGCGKTTLLKLIAGIETPTSGRIQMFNQDHKVNDRPKVGFVFQDHNLLPWLNVYENVTLYHKINRQKINFEKYHSWLQRLHLTSSESKYPHELSGGMKMRASILRALMMEPQILLLDEPFAALDEVIRIEIQADLFQIWKQEFLTVLFVTHAISDAAALCQRVLLLDFGAKIIGDFRQSLPTYIFPPQGDQLRLAQQIFRVFPAHMKNQAADHGKSS